MQLEFSSMRQNAEAVELNRFPPNETRPDVIALHGFMQTLHSWRHLGPKLAEHGKRLCAFDLKGHGRSPCPDDGRYSLADHAAPILAYIRRNDLRGLTLVGHSFGGGVALFVATRLMEEGRGRLAGLVLVDSFFDASAIRIRLLRGLGLLAAPLAAPLLRWEPFARFAVRAGAWTLCRNTDRVDEGAVASYANNLRQSGRLEALIATGRQIAHDDYLELQRKLPTIDVPTLIVWGRNEPLLPFPSCARLHRQFPNAELFPVENCGHLPHEEQREVVIAKIASFIAANGEMDGARIRAAARLSGS